MVRLACERHLRDLETGMDRGISWDLAAAERVFGYFEEVLRLNSDEGNHEGEPFRLHPAQKFIVGSLFGWKNADGTRRYRVAYIEISKGSGKSPLAAGIGLYMLTGDGESAAQVYSAAVDKDQAKVSFQFAVGFVNKSELLSGAITKSGGKYGDETRVHNLFHRKSGSYFRPLSSESSGKGKSGFLPHCVILDELHEHPSNKMVEFVRKNTKGRKQPLVLMITNSGEYNDSPAAWQYHEYADKVLNQIKDDDEFFFFVCGLDPARTKDHPDGFYAGDDYRDKACWAKANPLLSAGVPPMRYLEQQVREAEGMPSNESLTRRLNFCEWVESVNPWVSKKVWDANAGKVDRAALRGRRCFGGWDLSKHFDLTTLSLVFPNDDDTKDVLQFAWTPQEGILERENRDKAPYRQWIEEGHLTPTPGATIDYDFIALQVGEFQKEFKIESIAFDHWHFPEMDKALRAIGVDIPCFDHQQGFVGMNPAIEATEQDLVNRRLRHGGNPLLTWCVFNVKIEKNAAALRSFEKKKATSRIDAAVSLAMADHLTTTQPREPEYQVIFVGR